MSSLEVTPADVCQIGFLSLGRCTLGVLAHVTNENGSFAASLVFTYLVLGDISFDLGTWREMS